MSAPHKHDAAIKFTESSQPALHYLGGKIRNPTVNPVQEVHAWDSSDLTTRRVVAVGSGVQDLSGTLPWDGSPDSLARFLASAKRGASLEYIPSLANPALSFPCALIDHGEVRPDSELWHKRRFAADVRLRRIDGGSWQALLEEPLFYYRAGNLLQGLTFSRAGAVGAYFDEDGNLQSGIAADIWRIEWRDLDGDGKRETPVLLLEVTRTNVVLWSRDLTNAAWVKTNVTAAKDQTGIDGVASGASKITASAANGTCLQSITLASSARFQSCYVKRVTGSGVVEMTMDNGTTWTAVTVTAAWTRVTIPTQTLANPIVGFRIVTSGDAIAVDFVQNENGTYATSPIATTTAAAQRGTETYYGTHTHLPQASTWFLDFIEGDTPTWGDNYRLLHLGDAADSGARLIVRRVSGADTYQVIHASASGTSVNASVDINPASGNRIRLRAILNADGSVQIGAAKDTGSGFGAETVGTASGALALASAWSDTRIYLNGPVDKGNTGVIVAKGFTGAVSMATAVAA